MMQSTSIFINKRVYAPKTFDNSDMTDYSDVHSNANDYLVFDCEEETPSGTFKVNLSEGAFYALVNNGKNLFAMDASSEMDFDMEDFMGEAKTEKEFMDDADRAFFQVEGYPAIHPALQSAIDTASQFIQVIRVNSNNIIVPNDKNFVEEPPVQVTMQEVLGCRIPKVEPDTGIINDYSSTYNICFDPLSLVQKNLEQDHNLNADICF